MNGTQKNIARNLLAGALFAMAGLAQASSIAIIASDDFNSYAAGASLNGNGGAGWAGAWTDTTSSSVATTVAADSPMSGNAAYFSAPDNNNATTRQLGTLLNRSVYIDFLLQFDAGAINNNDFLGLWFNSYSGPNIGLKANCGTGGACTADLFARSAGTGGVFSTNILIGETHRLVGLLEKTGNSTTYNSYKLWVDPTAAELDGLTGWDAAFSGNSGLASFSTIGFRTANMDSGDGVLIDNLKIGVVPEPASLALLGLGLAGLGFLLRKRG